MSAAEIAFCSLTADDMEAIEAGESARDARVGELVRRSPRLLAEIFVVNNLANMTKNRDRP